MKNISARFGLGTLVTHAEEGDNPQHAHVTPIYQTSTFSFPDVTVGAAIVDGNQKGYYYTRLNNPNQEQFARKIALLEAVDLLRQRPEAALDDVAAGQVFTSGMSAVTSAILARAKAGDTIITQDAVYSNTFNFFQTVAPGLGIHVVWVKDISEAGWERAFREHPEAVLAYAETPANPTMSIVDLAMVARLAHQYNAWLAVDNTFASPYCQRPLSLGADIVIHSTTKYLSGHAAIIGGAVASTRLDYMRKDLKFIVKVLGGSSSPFDAWLGNMGLKTFELRMQRHCENAMAVARFLENHPKVGRVFYPGLESHPGHSIAEKQMSAYGGMLSFELKGGFQAGADLMNRVRVATLAVSLGIVDTVVSHPASMTHASVAREDRLKTGITDGLVRLSVGIENVADLISDLDQALS